MGLDMCLTRKTYVKNWDHTDPKERHEITIKRGGEIRLDVDPDKISHIEEEIGYWRKANQIHNWFVQNCQNGEDDCRSYYVEVEQLITLLNLCREIKEDNSKAEELLPAAEGFFFGETEYGKYYFQQIDETIQIIEGIVNDGDPDVPGTWQDYYYQSSW
jgi:hypothetical protein